MTHSGSRRGVTSLSISQDAADQVVWRRPGTLRGLATVTSPGQCPGDLLVLVQCGYAILHLRIRDYTTRPDL
jgi:hypothetical protein